MRFRQVLGVRALHISRLWADRERSTRRGAQILTGETPTQQPRSDPPPGASSPVDGERNRPRQPRLTSAARHGAEGTGAPSRPPAAGHAGSCSPRPGSRLRLQLPQRPALVAPEPARRHIAAGARSLQKRRAAKAEERPLRGGDARGSVGGQAAHPRGGVEGLCCFGCFL